MVKPIQELINKTMPRDAQERARHKADIILDEINFINQLRKHRHITQQQLAESLDTTQVNISLTERREGGVTLETVRRYVEAMGGRLEIKVRFPDETVRYGCEL
ncbi:MAG: XRE family transcriptional regulator [Pseudomonadales bacterium]